MQTRSPRCAWRALLLATAVGLACPSAVLAQATPNLERTARAESIRAQGWDHFFPIWGKKVVARGIELPLPVGLNAQWLTNYQDLSIGNLHLGVNNGGLVDVSSFLDVGKSVVETHSIQFRPDLWVLPFWNVYGLVGGGSNTIEVTVGKPVELKTTIDREAFIAGIGSNLSMAVQRYFVVVDGNLTWAKVDGLDELSRADVLSGRIGRSFLLPQRMRMAGWLGFARLGLQTETSGSIRLGDALPGIEDFFDNYQTTDWYMDLPPAQRAIVDNIFSEIAARGPGDSTIQYALDKDLTSQWSVVFGGQFQFNPSWMLRAEYSHSETRGALLINLNYRFGI